MTIEICDGKSKSNDKEHIQGIYQQSILAKRLSTETPFQFLRGKRNYLQIITFGRGCSLSILTI